MTLHRQISETKCRDRGGKIKLEIPFLSAIPLFNSLQFHFQHVVIFALMQGKKKVRLLSLDAFLLVKPQPPIIRKICTTGRKTMVAHQRHRKKCFRMVKFLKVRVFIYLFIFFKILYNYPLKGRWIVVDIYRDAKRRGTYRPLFTDPEGDSCFSTVSYTHLTLPTKLEV